MAEIPHIPFHFAEVFKVKVWGGRKLQTKLGKHLPRIDPVGESWEIGDHPHGMSVADEGPLKGATLHELVESDEQGLIGRAGALEPGGRFPLLYKLIDAADWLSVQVHPTDAYARKHESGDPGKTEAWCVIDAEPGAKLARGLKPGVTRDVFARAISDGTLKDYLNFIEVNRGDVLYMPSGMVHALGPGIMVAEIQQNSDTTYRVYDWDRMGLDGAPRELHVERALDVIDFGGSSPALAVPGILSESGPRIERLVACDKFTFDRYTTDESFDLCPAEMQSFIILTCVEGRAALMFDKGSRVLDVGQTVLVPAAIEELTVMPEEDVEFLAMSLPVKGNA